MKDRLILRGIIEQRMTWKQALDIAEAQIKKLDRKIVIDKMMAVRFTRRQGASDWREWVHIYVTPTGLNYQIGAGIREIGFYGCTPNGSWDSLPFGWFLET